MDSITDIIVQQATAAGIDPSIALAVARQESGLRQFNADGSVVTSSAGAIGVMQLEPATAAALGVDPYDTTDNIRGGCLYLAQLYNQFGSWSQALAAYNWGPGHVQNAVANATPIPSSVVGYVTSVLKKAGSAVTSAVASVDTSIGQAVGNNETAKMVVLLGAGGLALLFLVRIIRG